MIILFCGPSGRYKLVYLLKDSDSDDNILQVILGCVVGMSPRAVPACAFSVVMCDTGDSQHVTIIWVQVAQPRLLLLTLAGVLA